MKTDLFSFTQGNRHRISFMSQTIGLTADIDIETEHLRWMGDTRFVLGYLRASQSHCCTCLACHLDSISYPLVIARKSCPIELSMKVVDQDKSRMMDALYARRAGELACMSSLPSSSLSDDKKLDDTNSLNEQWTRFEKPILWMYAGQGPFVSR